MREMKRYLRRESNTKSENKVAIISGSGSGIKVENEENFIVNESKNRHFKWRIEKKTIRSYTMYMVHLNRSSLVRICSSAYSICSKYMVEHWNRDKQIPPNILLFFRLFYD